jgi:hypothetical protein
MVPRSLALLRFVEAIRSPSERRPIYQLARVGLGECRNVGMLRPAHRG